MKKILAMTLAMVLLLGVGMVTGIGAASASEDLVTLRMIGWDWGTLKGTQTEEEILQVIRDELGIDLVLELIPGDSYETKINLMFASNEQFDLYQDFGPDSWGPRLERGEILDLTPYLEEYGPNFSNPELLPENYVQWATLYKGMMAGLPNGQPTGNRHIVSVRQDWLDQLGIEAPATIEALEAYFDLVLDTDLNGNGTNDEVPLLTGAWIGTRSLKQYFLVNGGGDFIGEDGQYSPNFLDPNYEMFLAKMKEWYQKGYIWSEAFTCQDTQVREMEAQGLFGAMAFWYTEPGEMVKQAEARDPDTKISFTAINPEGPGLNELWGWNPCNKMYCIPASCSNPEAAVTLLNWLLGEEGSLLMSFGFEDRNFVYVDEERTVVERIEDSDYIGGFIANMIDRYPPVIPTLNATYDKAVSEMLLQIQEMPYQMAMNAYFAYDTSEWESEKYLNDMDTFISEMELAIITGGMEASEWSGVIEQWKAMGGEVYMQEITAAYEAYLAE